MLPSHWPPLLVFLHSSSRTLTPVYWGLQSFAVTTCPPHTVPISLFVKAKVMTISHKSNIFRSSFSLMSLATSLHLSYCSFFTLSPLTKPGTLLPLPFALAIAVAWNILPVDNCRAHALASFKSLLRCHLLNEAFPDHASATPWSPHLLLFLS